MRNIITDSVFAAWHQSGVWNTTKYRGLECQQSPMDLWSLQEIIFETKPRTILQIGVAEGGTLLWLADALARVWSMGAVIGVDIARMNPLLKRDGVHLIHGDSLHPETVEQVKQKRIGDSMMVIIDGDHRKRQVISELITYAKFVTEDCYLVVEDTCIDSFLLGERPGPDEALKEWLPHHPEFQVDDSRTRWGMSQHPGGYLKRIH